LRNAAKSSRISLPKTRTYTLTKIKSPIPYFDALPDDVENIAFLFIFSSSNIEMVHQERCKSKQHIFDLLKDIENKGGEGLMLRQPGSLYEPKRSSTLLKVKTFYDAEAVVIDHVKGKGKNSGVMGAIMVSFLSF
jgi:hypothetical protein